MSRRGAGLLLAALGFGIAALGVAGALLDTGPAPGPTVAERTPAETGTPDAPADPETPGDPDAAVPALTGTVSDPRGDLFVCGSEDAAPDGPAHLDLVRVTVREGTNPVTSAPSTNLLLDVAAAPEDPAVSFRAEAPVEPGGRMPDGVQLVEWRLVYEDGEFRREAVELRGDTPQPGPIEDFRVRYQGFGDRVEIEIYGPPGTRYLGAAITDGVVCDVADGA